MDTTLPMLPPPVSLRPVNTTASPTRAPIVTTPPTTPSQQANTTGSLYHLCRSVLDKLYLVKGMTTWLLDEEDANVDPLTKLTNICRQGFPLCTLYNATHPKKLLVVEIDPNLNAVNSCKANVYHFIVACRQNLLFPEEDMFTISDLYQDDTNGFVKVVNTINKLIQLLEHRGIIKVLNTEATRRNSDGKNHINGNFYNNNLTSDVICCTRDKVVNELLETERKYVADMEILQNYMRELQIQKIVSPDTIHYLFGNLNSLVDFQRRFLIQLEEIAEKAPLEQRIGQLFSSMKDAFSVYEPYCANYYSAQDLVVQETPRLQKLADILNPIYQLPSMLIKPVQRICKYPLLLNELLKATDQDWPYYQETKESVEAIKRVTEKVNETQRQHENLQAVQELKKRLEDDYKLDGYGNLLLQEKLLVTSTQDNNERDLHVFFFEKALLFCKESKGSTLLLQSNTLSINKKKTRRGSLVPKFILQTNLMTDLHSQCNKNGIWCLSIDSRQENMEHVLIKFRNEEQIKLWINALTRAMQKAAVESQHQIKTRIREEEEEEMNMLLEQEDSEIEFYDEEEEEEEEQEEEEQEEEEEEEEEDNYSRTRSCSGSNNNKKNKKSRSRSSSFNNTNSNSITAMTFLKSTSITSKLEKAVGSGGRPYHHVPGMNLSPLPRSTTSSNTLYYPASPPPSHPSSPTSSSRSTTTIRQPQQPQQQPLGEFLSFSNNEDSLLLSTGRSQSQSAVMERINNRLPIAQNNRLRSQSTPNILKVTLPPPLPTPPLSTSLLPVKTTTTEDTTTPPSPGTIKIKLNFNDGIYVIVTNQEVTYFELMEKVDKKIRLVANLKRTTELLRLKYQDEDGDFITINSDDDVQMAFEARMQMGACTANLFVSF